MKALIMHLTRTLRSFFTNAGRAKGCARFQLKFKEAGLPLSTGRSVGDGKCSHPVFRIYSATDGAPFLKGQSRMPGISLLGVCVVAVLVVLTSGCSSTRSMRLEAEQRILRKLKVCVGQPPENEKCGCIGTKGACRESASKGASSEAPMEDPDPPVIEPSQCEVVDFEPSVATLPNPDDFIPITSGEPWRGSIASEFQVEGSLATQCVRVVVNGVGSCQCHRRMVWLEESLRLEPPSLIVQQDSPLAGLSRVLGEVHANK